MKQEKRISKVVEQYDGDWPPEDAAGAVAWFHAKLADVPKEFRSTARIVIDSTSGYEDSYYATITVSYWRPETGEEAALREREAAEHAKQRRAKELRTLADLQAKYGR